jgi:hypothetical protein
MGENVEMAEAEAPAATAPVVRSKPAAYTEDGGGWAGPHAASPFPPLKVVSP